MSEGQRELIPQGVKTTAVSGLKIYVVVALLAVGLAFFLTVLGVGL